MFQLTRARTFFICLAVAVTASAHAALVAEEKTPEKSPELKGTDADDDYVTPPKEYFGLLEAVVGDFAEEYKIVKDYHATYAKLALKKEDTLNDRERDILKAYKDGRNITLILNATQELLGNIRENPLMHPQTRVEEMQQLMAIEKTWVELSTPKEVKPAKGQPELRKPSKQEEEEIAAFLGKVISLCEESKFKEVSTNYLWYSETSTPISKEKDSESWAKFYSKKPENSPAKLFKAILEGRQNWFMCGEYKAVLVREKKYEKDLLPYAICIGLDFDQEKGKWLFHVQHNRIDRFYKGALPELK